MKIKRERSFLSDLFHYIELKEYADRIIPVGTFILLILFLLSKFVHWEFISELLSCCTGISILFIVYVITIIAVLDFPIEVEEEVDNALYYDKKTSPKPEGYNWTILWGILLCVLGAAAIYFSEKYSKRYQFECSTLLVDRDAGIYHLDYDNDCEEADKADNLVKMKGYQLKDTSYELCDWCDGWADDAESEYIGQKYIRR